MENVRFIFSGNEQLQSGMVDQDGAAVIRVEDLPAELKENLAAHLYR